MELANRRDAVQVEFDAQRGRVRAVSEPLFIPSWLARGYWTDTAGIPTRRLAQAVAAAQKADAGAAPPLGPAVAKGTLAVARKP